LRKIPSSEVNLDYAQVPRGPSLTKLPGLKAEPNLANGGIGVSYSNVVLGGGLNPNDPTALAPAKSSY